VLIKCSLREHAENKGNYLVVTPTKPKPTTTHPTRVTGQRGEQLALEHLHAQGYEILDSNWHCAYGEIDIIARQQDVIVFVEVRARHSGTTEAAFESIQSPKQRKLIKSALAYLETHQLDESPWRIDVIAIALSRSGDTLDHVEDALDW
jgi:putative endonuclease